MNPPPPVPESSTNNADGTPAPTYSDPDCPFCTIISNYPPISPLSPSSQLDYTLDPNKLDPPAFVLLSTADVVAFFDVYPLTRGHVLVCPRRHAEKVGDLSGREGCEVRLSFRYGCSWLRVCSGRIFSVLESAATHVRHLQKVMKTQDICSRHAKCPNTCTRTLTSNKTISSPLPPPSHPPNHHQPLPNITI